MATMILKAHKKSNPSHLQQQPRDSTFQHLSDLDLSSPFLMIRPMATMATVATMATMATASKRHSVLDQVLL